ncbi:putative acyl-protein thioesterase [Podospora australis]|uniref:Acyl-protein thioesterase n=1 Tax=Podospora australis TaxID=1536484 RepID=A0AAN7AE84_9PEZI|nr:putative acyl-protein thioesterase [Podospora australis]
MSSLKTVTIAPTFSQTHTVIFLHGRGDTAENFSFAFTRWCDSQSRSLADLFPSIKWVFPQSEIRPLARHQGSRISQWFDTWDIANLSEKEDLQIPGLKESVIGIREIVEQEVDELDGQWAKVFLAGISQGGATAVHTLLNLTAAGGLDQDSRLGGLMIFSGRMPFPGRTITETRAVLCLDGVPGDNELVRNTPALVQHCIDDHLSYIANGRAVRDSLKGFGVQVTWHEYPVGGHWLHSPNGLEDTAHWLRRHIMLTTVQ